MTVTTEPAEVLRDERPSQSGGTQGAGDIDREPMVDLLGSSATELAHRDLHLGRFLAGCNAVGVQAVPVPCQAILAVGSPHQRQMPRTAGAPHLAVRRTSLLLCLVGWSRWCVASPLSRRFLMSVATLSIWPSPDL